MAGFYIRLERDIPGLNSFLGKALSKAEPEIITPLMEFFSLSPDDAAFAAAEGVEIEAPEQQWFSAKDGLASVRGIAAKIRADESNDAAAKMLFDLSEFERVLEKAEEKNVRWSLGVDY